VSGELTITGAGAPRTTIDANQLDRAFDVLPAASLKLEHLTVRRGLAGLPGGGGVLIEDGGYLELSKVVLRQNKAEASSGGGINHLTNATSRVNNSTITGNEAGIDGGGIIVRNPGVASTIVNSTISDNTAGSVGGGIASLAVLEIRNSTIEGNRTLLAGGAGIYHTQETLTLQNSRVHDNRVTAGGDGGGLVLGQGANATIRNGSVSGNRVNTNGGGITVINATLSLVHVRITDNVADADGSGNGDGGGISIFGDSTVTSTNTTVESNQDGGAPFFPDCFPAAPCPP
jgi:hypothetical protein